MQRPVPRHADARVFRALATAYHQPTEALYRAEYLDGLQTALAEAGSSDLLPLVEQLAGGLAATPDLTELTVAYCRLFFGPGKLVAPPYESIYRGGGVTMGEPALDVIRRYDEAGVQVWEGFRNCPDHIAAELEFLYFAATEAANFGALGREVTAQGWARRYQEFLDEHLAIWVKQFAAKVLEGSENGFYRGLAELTVQWVGRRTK